MWLSNTKKKKKTQTSKTQWKEGKRTKSGKERESMPFRANVELLSAVLPPLSRRRLGGSESGYVSPLPSSNHLSSSIRSQPKPQALSLHCWPISTFVFLFRYGFRRLCLCFIVDFGLCLCFNMGFGVCVCVLAWISSWVSSFAYISGLGFGLSLHFGLGFCWLFSIFCFRFGLLIFLLVFSSFSALFIFLVLLH